MDIILYIQIYVWGCDRDWVWAKRVIFAERKRYRYEQELSEFLNKTFLWFITTSYIIYTITMVSSTAMRCCIVLLLVFVLCVVQIKCQLSKGISSDDDVNHGENKYLKREAVNDDAEEYVLY